MARRRFPAQIPTHEPTPQHVFLNRRQFVALGAGLVATATAVDGQPPPPTRTPIDAPFQRPGVFPARRNEAYALPSGIPSQLTPREVAATHNNFYEFLPGRGGPVWKFTADFVVEPWKVEITGECAKPTTLDLDALFAFAHEERLYHFRCVERWAMNVPWSGFPLRKLLERAEPKSTAQFVRFLTVERPAQMPGMREAAYYPWPYHEALRIEEAMHELAFAVTGAYGEPLLKQHGAPIRVAVPWKYGYKNPKSIVQIEFLKEQPKTFWQMQPHEYGFLSNINPFIPHPRWSQAESHWIDSQEPFPTPLFNGYEKYVAALYPDEPRTPQRPLREGQIAR